jgi:prepilin-type N-terminal cleavage/methylation domain-containing protein
VQALPIRLTVSRRRARRGFTLIELVTATSLMTVMMLGMVQIFGVITQTASEAQGLQFAQEQARGILDTIHRDLRGMTTEGYLKIVPSPASPTAQQYAGDSLALTTVGTLSGAWNTAAQSTSGSAEILYTLQVADGKKSAAPNFVWLGSAGSSNPSTTGARRSILARGQWMTIPASSSADNSGGDATDFSDARYLSEFNADPTTPRKRRVDKYTNTGVPYTYVWPLYSTAVVADLSTNSPSLRRVAGSCTSEFFVEYLVWDGNKDYVWKHGTTVDIKPGAHTFAGGCPRAIRVTLAIHDPDDRKPLAATPGAKRFQGFALQEVYWIRDP